MSAQTDIRLKENQVIANSKKHQKKGIKHHIDSVRNTISKYVVYDKDAIFKDPNWPYY